MWLIDRIAEQRIAEAIGRGEFDNLPGAGKPLCLDDEAPIPEELRVAYRILKNAGFVPPEVELRRELHEVGQLLATLRTEGTRAAAAARLDCLLRRLSLARGGRADALLDEHYYQQLVQRLEPNR